MPPAQHMYKFDAGQRTLRPAERFESQHRAGSSFDVSVILLHKLFRYLFCLMVLVSSSGLPALSVASAAVLAPPFIYGYHLRFTQVPDSLAKEAQRGCRIPPGGQQEVDGLPRGINRPGLVFPLAFDFKLPDDVLMRQNHKSAK